MLEEISPAVPECQPLWVLWCSFVRPCPTNHYFLPDALISWDNIPSLLELSDTAISVSRSILCQTFMIRLRYDYFMIYFMSLRFMYFCNTLPFSWKFTTHSFYSFRCICHSWLESISAFIFQFWTLLVSININKNYWYMCIIILIFTDA